MQSMFNQQMAAAYAAGQQSAMGNMNAAQNGMQAGFQQNMGHNMMNAGYQQIEKEQASRGMGDDAAKLEKGLIDLEKSKRKATMTAARQKATDALKSEQTKGARRRTS